MREGDHVCGKVKETTFEDRLCEFIREEWCYDAKKTGAVEDAAVNLILKDLAEAFNIDLEDAING